MTELLFRSDYSLTSDPDDDLQLALAGVRALLRLMGDDPDRNGLADTPHRFVRALREITSPAGDPAVDLATVFDEVRTNGSPVVVGPIDFVSVCEHHLLPFTGVAWVSYVPAGGRVVGLSKLPRTVKHFAARPQVQERLTSQIAQAIEDHVKADGVGVLVRASHACMTLRGVLTPNAEMTTYDLRGSLDRDPLRGEFFAAVRDAAAR
jgi:GTP cyclohydrolase I